MKKILIVEDEPDVLKLIVSRLRENKFDTLTARDGQEALEQARKNKPDLIVLDLMLPKLDGGTVCKELKQDNNYSDIPIIMLTAKDTKTDIVMGKLQGADWYIAKPFDAVFLIAKINELLREKDNNQGRA